MISSAGILRLWAVNCLLAGLMVVLALFVDGNGRLPGMNETPSIIVIACLAGVGILTDALLGWLDSKRRLIAVAVGVVYVVIFMPAMVG